MLGSLTQSKQYTSLWGILHPQSVHSLLVLGHPFSWRGVPLTTIATHWLHWTVMKAPSCLDLSKPKSISCSTCIAKPNFMALRIEDVRDYPRILGGTMQVLGLLGSVVSRWLEQVPYGICARTNAFLD
jgi:hypothetical protein